MNSIGDIEHEISSLTRNREGLQDCINTEKAVEIYVYKMHRDYRDSPLARAHISTEHLRAVLDSLDAKIAEKKKELRDACQRVLDDA